MSERATHERKERAAPARESSPRCRARRFVALELGMQGGRSLWGLAIFFQLACGGSAREFGHKDDKAGAGGASASAGASATGGHKTSSGGSEASDGGSNASDGGSNASGGGGNASGGPPAACNPQPEDCFNGTDDDCDDLLDCADSDCTETTLCVPTEAWTYGTALDEKAACPEGFRGAPSTVHGGLSGGNGCSGCACISADPECGPYTVTLSQSQDNCATPGPVVARYTLYQFNAACAGTSVQSPWNYVTFTSTPTFNCTNTGTPTLSAPTWTDSSKFCPASATGGGCAAGNVCVPKATGSACLLASGAQECPAQFPKKKPLYTAYADTRACFCDCKSRGGNCDQVTLNVTGTTPDCSDTVPVRSGGNACTGQDSASSKFVRSISGKPSPATSCESLNVMDGTLTPSGPQTLCCR